MSLAGLPGDYPKMSMRRRPQSKRRRLLKELVYRYGDSNPGPVAEKRSRRPRWSPVASVFLGFWHGPLGRFRSERPLSCAKFQESFKCIPHRQGRPAAIHRCPKKGNMPTRITLTDRLAERIAVLAAEAGQPVDAFVERVLQGLVDADIEIRDGIPVFRMPPDAPVLTSADVDRLLHRDLHQ